MTKRFGFTLAEVLITLAIIGVVAAMTIPTLVANYQTKAWNTSATVFERKLTEALKVMNTQQTLAGHKTTESFVEELSKHFKITKTCANDKLQECFSEAVYWGNDGTTTEMDSIKLSSDFGHNTWGTNIVGLQFANGTNGLIAYNPSCIQDPYSNQFNGTGCIALLYDTSGYKKPNTNAKDLRSINVVNLGNASNCTIEVDGLCFTAPFKPAPISYEECLNQQSALGLKYCCQDCDSGSEIMTISGDIYAGLAATCGGVSKIPTKAQLSKLASHLYGGSVGVLSEETPSYECENGSNCLNEELAASYGLNADESLGGFVLIAGDHATRSDNNEQDLYETLYVESYAFTPQGVQFINDLRNGEYFGSYYSAVCLSN